MELYLNLVHSMMGVQSQLSVIFQQKKSLFVLKHVKSNLGKPGRIIQSYCTRLKRKRTWQNLSVISSQTPLQDHSFMWFERGLVWAGSESLCGPASLSKRGWESGNRGLIEEQPGHACAHTNTRANMWHMCFPVCTTNSAHTWQSAHT